VKVLFLSQWNWDLCRVFHLTLKVQWLLQTLSEPKICIIPTECTYSLCFLKYILYWGCFNLFCNVWVFGNMYTGMCFVLFALCFMFVFMYVYSYLFCLYKCKDYCHRATTQLQFVIIIIMIIINEHFALQHSHSAVANKSSLFSPRSAK